MKDVICIVGPTASGKTSLGIALAERINGEIISADSMQIYQKLDIGTAKVTKEEMKDIPHHMIDIISMEQDFSVADFQKKCYEKIEDIISRGKVPILVGGTGLYVSSVIQEMDFKDQVIDQEYRNQLYQIAEKQSPEILYEMLRKVDAQSANEIHPNNVKRVIRALELSHQDNIKSLHMEKERQEKTLHYHYHVYCLNLDKKILHERINQRVEDMIKTGLEKEAYMVYNTPCKTAKQAVGYKEFFDYFQGLVSLHQVIEEIKLRTRQYAKRQMTWFKKMPNVYSLDAMKPKEILIDEIMENKNYEQKK